jgi:hypothetical protein
MMYVTQYHPRCRLNQIAFQPSLYFGGVFDLLAIEMLFFLTLVFLSDFRMYTSPKRLHSIKKMYQIALQSNSCCIMSG